MSTAITLTNLRKVFDGKTVAVDGVDLTIAKGSLFFLLGPSGCGKTTLLRMLAGFAEPTGGTIHFGDRDVTHTPPNKRHCGMVFQGYAIWPHMTVEQNVMFGLKVRSVGRRERRERVAKALAMVRMTDYAHRKPNQLSGGQQQRVALARAMVIEPTVLLLDEPLSNLDAKLRLEMRSEIRRICQEADMTAVYVTHDQKEALSMADDLAVMLHGKVVQQGPPATLYQRPGNRFVADFLGETNFLSAQVTALEPDRVVLEHAAGRLTSMNLPADGEQPLKVGGNVTCSIRPEAIRVATGETDAATGGDGANRFTATRQAMTYLGETAQHQVALSDGTLLKAFELNPRQLPDVSGGDVDVAFDPRDVVILQD